MEDKKERFIIVIGIIFLIISVILIGFLFYSFILWQREEGGYEGYDKVKIGDTREQVIELMGEPYNESAEFHLMQERGYEKEYAEAANSNATTWLYYQIKFDLTATIEIAAIGLDSNDIVVYKAKGGS